MAHDVFISYSTRDKAMADAACHALETQKIRCWYAPRDISSGALWAEALVDAIAASRVFVLIFSDGSNSSPQVLREVVEAAERGIPIIPVRVEEVLPTKAMAYYLRTIQWLDALTPEMDRHLERLVRRVQALLQVEPPPPPPPPPPRKRKLSAPAIGLIVAAVALLAVGLGWVLSRSGGEGRATQAVAQTTKGGPTAVAEVTTPSPTSNSATAEPSATASPVPPGTSQSTGATIWAATPAPESTGQPGGLPTPLSLAGTPLPEPAAALSPANAAQAVQLARWGEEVPEIERSTAGFLAMALDPAGELLAMAPGGEPAQLWSARDGAWQLSLDEEARRVAFSPDGRRLAVTGFNTLSIWSTWGDRLASPMMYFKQLRALAWDCTGELLALGGYDKVVFLYRVSDLNLLHTLDGHEGRIAAVAFSPDGQVLASAPDPDMYTEPTDHVRLWSMADGEPAAHPRRP